MFHLKDLSYHPPATPKPILQNINLQLAPQELGLIIGPSGSGKSTLLEILAGLAKKTSGDIKWGDRDLKPADLQQYCGLVFQFPERHFCGSTILEELLFGRDRRDFRDRYDSRSISARDKVKQTLQEVGLGDLALNGSPFALSGGQQRRLALAVQLIRQPNLLMLDEPTAGLDWSMRRQLSDLLVKLKSDWTLLIVTHDASDLLPIADRCWTIDRGSIQSVDPNSLVKL